MTAMQQPDIEQIPSGEFSASAVAQCNPALYADVTDVFMLLDPLELTDQAMKQREVDFQTAVAAVDDWFGQIADSLADEDGDV